MTQQEILNSVVQIILRHAKPQRIYLFGSQASGEATQGSDIDIAYDAPESGDHAAIQEEIGRLKTLVKIEVKDLAHVEERFRQRVIATGTVLYSGSKQLRAEDGLWNFSRALERFSEALAQRETLTREGFADVIPDLLLQRFEFTYEMAWKAIKRYLSFAGIECASPRACFQEAYAQGLIADEAVCLDMIEKRNLSSHIYSETEIRQIIPAMDAYQAAFSALRSKLQEQLQKTSR